MSTNIFILTLALVTCPLLTYNLQGQGKGEMSRAEHHRMDSAQARHKSDQIETQKTRNEARMTEVKLNRRQSSEKAKEAKRIGREAAVAARESRQAYKAEKRAQRARRQADRQAIKASKAKRKSDAN